MERSFQTVMIGESSSGVASVWVLRGGKCLNRRKEGENIFLMGEMPRTKA